jgi:molybdopterin-guanine dinucleotide biosynthesis protein A
MTSPEARFDAVVLAGGSGRRLGGVDKPGLDAGGMTLLDRVLTACAGTGAGPERTVVVGPERPTARPVAWAREDPPGGGPLAAFAAGLATLARLGSGPDRVLLLASDLPLLRPTDLAGLLDPPPDADAVVLVDATGRRQPLTALYRAAAAWAALAHLGDLTGRPLRGLLAELTVTERPARPGATDDCDTPADLAAARRRLAAPSQPH